MIEAAPAKLNLALHVRRRRADGYHDLETLFAFTAFGDRLAVQSHNGLALGIAGPMAAAITGTDDPLRAASGNEDNLVLRAARALADAAGIAKPKAALILDKHIPVAAGLGGGSADAAAALRLLNRFWRLDWPPDRLAEVAVPLGADVPACVFSRTMTGTGTGEALAAVDLGLAGTPVLLVNPRVAVPTGPVFAGWDGVDHGPLAVDGCRTARNDLTAPALRLAPVIGEVLAALTATDAAFVRMSGSGATCFALYRDAAAAASAGTMLARDRPGWWQAATTLTA